MKLRSGSFVRWPCVVALTLLLAEPSAAQPVPWPAFCQAVVEVPQRLPNEQRAYEVRVRPAVLRWFGVEWIGAEIYWYWQAPDRSTVLVHSRLDGTLLGEGDYEHCRQEVWAKATDGSRVLSTVKAVKQDKAGLHVIQALRENAGYRYTYTLDDGERQSQFVSDPTGLASMTNDSIVTNDAQTLIDVFTFTLHDDVRISSPGQSNPDHPLGKYVIAGDLERILWYDNTPERRLTRLCDLEIKNTIIELRSKTNREDVEELTAESCEELY